MSLVGDVVIEPNFDDRMDLSPATREQFRRTGHCVVRGLATSAEIAEQIKTSLDNAALQIDGQALLYLRRRERVSYPELDGATGRGVERDGALFAYAPAEGAAAPACWRR